MTKASEQFREYVKDEVLSQRASDEEALKLLDFLFMRAPLYAFKNWRDLEQHLTFSRLSYGTVKRASKFYREWDVARGTR